MISIAHRGDWDTRGELTADHTLRWQLRESGESDAEIEATPADILDRVMTRGFGFHGGEGPEIREMAWEDGDLFVLAPRSFIRDLAARASGPMDTDRRGWLRRLLDEGVEREVQSPVLLFAERMAR